ncbi:hypothetical protein [Bacteroides nordii]|uniref:hypothetical protein n=1 Tax=Bacteroides nordii TaxID=291645 RepID=UPI002040B80B|nr:hypothetical protein [Bacteroides nordii]GFZ39405.1 hypothetical protein BANORC5_14400 [Bacteroides nordii]
MRQLKPQNLLLDYYLETGQFDEAYQRTQPLINKRIRITPRSETGVTGKFPLYNNMTHAMGIKGIWKD